MGLNKATGVVIHSRKHGETSKILTVYSREKGLLSLMAKGSRSVRSKYLGMLETLNEISFVYYFKENRGMQYLNEASVLQSFPGIRSQLGKSALAAIPFEVIRLNEWTEHDNPELYRRLLEMLNLLDTAAAGGRNAVRHFLLQYIRLSGVQPQLQQCEACGNTELGDHGYISLQDGAYGCAECGAFQESGFRLSGDALNVLRWFQKVPAERVVDLKLSRPVGENIDQFIFAYLKAHFENLQTLKSVEYLRQLELDFREN